MKLKRIWKIAVRSVQGFWDDRCFLYAASLTFYTLMSIVPLFAMALAIAKGLGLHDYLQSNVLERFQGQKEIFVEVIQFAQKMLEEARGGLLAAVGVAVLFLSVITLFKNMEDAFNRIWKVEKSRGWRRILIDYSALMIAGPLLFLFASSVTVFLATQLKGVVPIAIRLIPYGIFWILFTLFFLFIPNTRVRFSSAAIAGILSTIFYFLAQGAYVYSQLSAARYGAIYGSFAALPLFLVWLQLSWSILLFGGQISHAYQTSE